MPLVREFAAEFTLMVTVVDSPPASVPLLDETVSQIEVLIMDQFKDKALKLVRVMVWEAGEKGPPGPPLTTFNKEKSGKIPSGSGGPAKTVIKL